MKSEALYGIPWRQAGGVVVAVVLLAVGSMIEGRTRRGQPARGDGWLGIRAVAANFAWIGAQAAWEREDPVATTAAIQRAVTWDPDRSLFWLNGARMMAYDLAAWRIAGAGGPGVLPAALEQRWRDEQARRALAHLAAARALHPHDFNLPIEQGNIELWARGNLAGAAAAFGQAANMAGAPDYALRLEIGLLRRLGRAPEALRRLEERRAVRHPSGVWINEAIELLRWELEIPNH
ncbi:MAG TPA: hypothetical protein VGD88_13555 [Opitutaceae bacterium]